MAKFHKLTYHPYPELVAPQHIVIKSGLFSLGRARDSDPGSLVGSWIHGPTAWHPREHGAAVPNARATVDSEGGLEQITLLFSDIAQVRLHAQKACAPTRCVFLSGLRPGLRCCWHRTDLHGVSHAGFRHVQSPVPLPMVLELLGITETDARAAGPGLKATMAQMGAPPAAPCPPAHWRRPDAADARGAESAVTKSIEDDDTVENYTKVFKQHIARLENAEKVMGEVSAPLQVPAPANSLPRRRAPGISPVDPGMSLMCCHPPERGGRVPPRRRCTSRAGATSPKSRRSSATSRPPRTRASPCRPG
jgi:hypothetical protein